MEEGNEQYDERRLNREAPKPKEKISRRKLLEYGIGAGVAGVLGVGIPTLLNYLKNQDIFHVKTKGENRLINEKDSLEILIAKSNEVQSYLEKVQDIKNRCSSRSD